LRGIKRYSLIPDNERKTILEAYASGATMKDAALLCGYPGHACVWLLKDEGILPCPPRNDSRRYMVDETFFDVIDTPEKAYWAGFILADGFIHRVKGQLPGGVGIRLASVDRGHLEKFKTALSSDHPIRHEVSNPSPGNIVQGRHPSDKIVIYSIKLAASLGRLGIVPAKSKIVEPYLDFPKELHRHYWRGAVDGDGCIFFHNISWGVNLVGTKAVVDAFKAFLLANGVLSNAQVLPKQSIFSFTVAGSRVSKQVADLLYKDATIYLDRKYEKYLELMQAPIKHQDLDAYSSEDLEALLAEHGSWTATAKAMNLTRKQTRILRAKLGMPHAPYAKTNVPRCQGISDLTAEDLSTLLAKHGDWINVAKALGSSPRYLRTLRQKLGMSTRTHKKKTV